MFSLTVLARIIAPVTGSLLTLSQEINSSKLSFKHALLPSPGMTQGTTQNIGANAGRSRSHNRQVVMSAVRSAGEIGRAEVARASGLSIQAVSNIMAELEADGLLAPTGRRSIGRGQPAMQYALNPKGGIAIGFELRPNAVFSTLLDLDGEAIYRRKRSIPRAEPEMLAPVILAERDRAVSETGISLDALLGAGIVLPGPFGATGLSGQQSELPGWQDLDVRHWFSQTLNLPAVVENDANAAALAERVAGAALGMASYAYLYFGAGLGLGIVNHGRLLRGGFGNAGEIGHIQVPAGGALESHVSRLSVERHLAAAGEEITSGADLIRLHAAGSSALADWLASTAAPLSFAIQTIENLFDPESIILGGAMPAPLIDEMITRVALAGLSLANRPDRSHPRLMRGASGQWTATRGAAALVINQVFTPQITAES